MTDAPNSELQSIPSSGAPPKTRVANCGSLNEIVGKLFKDDDSASKNRADVQKMLDGAPPWNPSRLRETGQEDFCNLNWGDGEAALAAAMAGYHDLSDSVETLARFYTRHGRVEQRSDWEGKMGEEFHFSVKKLSDFEQHYQYLIHQFVAHGVGVAYFTDETTPWWSVAGLDDFKIPRGTRANARESQVAACYREMTPAQLYKFIEDEEISRDRGWNVEETRKAIVAAASSSGIGVYTSDSWEKLQAQLKGNDLHVGTVGSQPVKLVHVWVQEFDGKVSHYVTLRDGSNEDYLFEAPSRFDSIDRCFIFFTYGIGTNGLFHSIRGLAHKIFPFVQTLNELRCHTVHGAKLSSSIVLQPEDENSAQDLDILYYNGFAVINPGVRVLDRQIPNLSTNSLPVMRELAMVMQNNTGSYQSRGSSPDGQERTKFEVAAQLQQESVLSTASVNLFYQPWGRLLMEQARRFTAKGVTKDDPGGADILDFQQRCLDRGVPIEALHAVYRVEPNRAVGYGSPQARLLAMDEAMGMLPMISNEVGKNNLLRDRFAVRFPYTQVDRYVPAVDQEVKPPIDAKMAEMETALMLSGQPMSVGATDLDILHATVHLGRLGEVLQQLEQAPELEDLQMQGLGMVLEHSSQHLQLGGQDPTRAQEVAGLNQAFNQMHGVAQRLMSRFAKEQESQAAAGGGEMAPELQQKMQKHQFELQMKAEAHQLKMQQLQESAQQKMALRDAAGAEKIRASSVRQQFQAAQAADRQRSGQG